VEITTQACGIKGYGDTTVKLSRQQYQNLEQYLVEFRARLNQTSTREEAVPIFKNAVVELDTYGLLPKGMSVERAQKLVVGVYQNEKLMKRLSKLNEHKKSDSNHMVNYLCLITGEDDDTVFFPFSSLFSIGVGALSIAVYLSFIFIIATILGFLFPGLPLILLAILALIPLAFFGAVAYCSFQLSFLISPIILGSSGYTGFYDYPASGWIQSYGLNGQKSINGSFYGNLYRLRLLILWSGLGALGIIFNFPSIAGFSGIKIYTPSKDKIFFLGFALAIEMGPEAPDWEPPN